MLGDIEVVSREMMMRACRTPLVGVASTLVLEALVTVLLGQRTCNGAVPFHVEQVSLQKRNATPSVEVELANILTMRKYVTVQYKHYLIVGNKCSLVISVTGSNLQLSRPLGK